MFCNLYMPGFLYPSFHCFTFAKLKALSWTHKLPVTSWHVCPMQTHTRWALLSVQTATTSWTPMEEPLQPRCSARCMIAANARCDLGTGWNWVFLLHVWIFAWGAGMSLKTCLKLKSLQPRCGARCMITVNARCPLNRAFRARRSALVHRRRAGAESKAQGGGS